MTNDHSSPQLQSSMLRCSSLCVTRYSLFVRCCCSYVVSLIRKLFWSPWFFLFGLPDRVALRHRTHIFKIKKVRRKGTLKSCQCTCTEILLSLFYRTMFLTSCFNLSSASASVFKLKYTSSIKWFTEESYPNIRITALFLFMTSSRGLAPSAVKI